MDYSIETPVGIFNSFAEAEEAGCPIACAVFVLCDRPASVVMPHPVLTAVPACERCADKCRQLA